MLLTKTENKFLLELLEEEKDILEATLKNPIYASFSPDKVRKQKIVCELIRKLKGWV